MTDTDIVERLLDSWNIDTEKLCEEAAAEIEALRRDCLGYLDEIDALRAQINEQKV